jgi:glycosyltransferase involved in cell wall biosynthesis
VRQTPTRRVMNWAFVQLARAADHILTISQFSAADIAEGLRIPPERITAIPLGVDETFFERADAQPVLERHGLRPGYFLFVGTLQPRKNLGRLIAAHEALPPQVRERHPLVIAGREGWGADSFRVPLERAIASGHCRWLRYVPAGDLPALLQQAHALVFPSLYEGFGLPVLEAFACGTPVAASSATSIPEVAGNAALLMDPLRTEELRDAMLRLAEDGALARQLADRGLERARQFSWSTTVERTLQVYRRFAEL